MNLGYAENRRRRAEADFVFEGGIIAAEIFESKKVFVQITSLGFLSVICGHYVFDCFAFRKSYRAAFLQTSINSS